jgi:hypothetical protein
MMNYDNKKFRGRSNSANGEVSGQTVFHYSQKDNVLTGTYSGGSVQTGHLLGTVNDDGSLDFLYHHRNTEGLLQAGRCHSIPSMVEGVLVLSESWRWFTGDASEGFSEVEEVFE